LLLFIVVATAAHIFRFVRASETETRSGKSISKSATSSQQQRKRLTETERERDLACELHSQTLIHFTSLHSTHSFSHSLTTSHTAKRQWKTILYFLSFCLIVFSLLLLHICCSCCVALSCTRKLTHTHTLTDICGNYKGGRPPEAAAAVTSPYAPLSLSMGLNHCPFIRHWEMHTRERESAESESSARLSETHKKLTFSRRADDVTRLRLQLGCFYMCVSKRASHIHTHTHIYINTDARRRWKSLSFR